MNRENVYDMGFGGILSYMLKRLLLLVAKLAGLKGVCLCTGLILFMQQRVSATVLVSIMGLVLCNASGQHFADRRSVKANAKEMEEEHEEEHYDENAYPAHGGVTYTDTAVRGATNRAVSDGMQRLRVLLADSNSYTGGAGGSGTDSAGNGGQSSPGGSSNTGGSAP